MLAFVLPNEQPPRPVNFQPSPDMGAFLLRAGGQMTPGIVGSTGGRTADLVEKEALVKTNPNGKKPRQICTV